MKTIEARLILEHGRAAIGVSKDGTPKYPTQSQAEAAAHTDIRYLEALDEQHQSQRQHLQLKETADIYEGDVSASAQKGKMLELLGFNIRRELSQKDGYGGIR